MLFGRAQEEIAALAEAGIEVEAVPGISAAFGASSALGLSLTRRGLSRSVVFLTPAVGSGERPHAWADAARGADTVVLYMASRQAEVIAQGLMATGMPPGRPAVLVENASLPGQRVLPTTLGQLADTARELGGGRRSSWWVISTPACSGRPPAAWTRNRCGPLRPDFISLTLRSC